MLIVTMVVMMVDMNEVNAYCYVESIMLVGIRRMIMMIGAKRLSYTSWSASARS